MIGCVVAENPHGLLGSVVISKQGRDRGKPGVIFGWIEGDFALVADGRLRTISKPKKKNMKHLYFTGYRLGELSRRLLTGGQVTDGMISEGLSAFGEWAKGRTAVWQKAMS